MKRLIYILFLLPFVANGQIYTLTSVTYYGGSADSIYGSSANDSLYRISWPSGTYNSFVNQKAVRYFPISKIVGLQAALDAKGSIADTSNMLQHYRDAMIAAASKTANLSGTNTGDQIISDATISTTDITTNNVSTSKHGFAPKGNGSSTSYLDGTGAYSTPSATTGSFTFLSGDVTNNNASANTIADVTGLSFSVSSGVTYKFRFFIVYTSAATTTGSRWSINGPATTYLNYNSTYTLTATSQTLNSGVAAYNSPSGASASSLSSNNIAIIEGIIKPSASGTVIARFASEISSSAIVAKANQSYVEFQAIN